MTSSPEISFYKALRRDANRVARPIIALIMRVREEKLRTQSVQQVRFSMTKLMQSARLTQIARMDTIIVYTQPLDTAALRVAAAKRWRP